jgi:hypothetical protein
MTDTKLRWYRPVDSVGIDHYEVRWRPFNERSWNMATFTDIKRLSYYVDYEIDGLVRHTPYFFSVTSRYSDGSSSTISLVWEESMWSRTNGTPPRAPEDLRFEVVDSSSIRLHWKRPQDTGPIDYEVSVICWSSVGHRIVPGGYADSFTTLLTDMPKGCMYQFYVTAIRHGIRSASAYVNGDYLLGY